MDLEDKAAETPDVELVKDTQYSAWWIADTELAGPNDISGEDEFPEFGDFLPVRASEDGTEMYIECPQDLARQLVELDLGEGDAFRIETATKVDGTWEMEVQAGSEKS